MFPPSDIFDIQVTPNRPPILRRSVGENLAEVGGFLGEAGGGLDFGDQGVGRGPGLCASDLASFDPIFDVGQSLRRRTWGRPAGARLTEP